MRRSPHAMPPPGGQPSHGGSAADGASSTFSAAPSPLPVSEWVDQLRSLDLSALGPRGLAVLTGELQRLRRMVDGVLTRTGEQALRTGAVENGGCRDVADWMGRAASGAGVKVTPDETLSVGRMAERLVTEGHAGGQLAPLQKALASGEVSMTHARTIAEQVDRMATFAPEISDAALAGLIEAAKDGSSRKALIGAADDLLRRHQSPSEGKIQQARRFSRRSFGRFSPVGDGTFRAEIVSDPASMAAIESALTAFGAPQPDAGTGERDPRTTEQRRMDALLSMTATIAASDATVVVPSAFRDPQSSQRQRLRVRGSRAAVRVVVDTEALRRGGVGYTLVNGQPLEMSEVMRLCCEGNVAPVLLGTDGDLLAAGRELRLASPEIRRALEVRDGGCSFPGCHASALICECHHGDLWSEGGETRADRMALVCGYHHRLAHLWDLTFEVTGHGARWNLDNLPSPWAPKDVVAARSALAQRHRAANSGAQASSSRERR